MDQQQLIDSLPAHMRHFVACQDYANYSPRDHAVWRFTLHHLSKHLKRVAHPVYLEGLQRTGISLEHVPSIDAMNECLRGIGWQAVVVDGFIPPAIFMEFQALRVLPVALAMRSVDQILYTPAPDIVHEAAGHAPFLIDVDYAEFLQRFGEIGMRAIANQQDEAVYQAIRDLSVVKQRSSSNTGEIAQAERNFNRAVANNTELSEAAMLARLHWWSVEYGLVGEPDNYQVFGAGLLSSLGESVHCLNDQRIRKIPLSVEVIRTAYDITREQPQLFVTRDCKHLMQVLETFARSMCYVRGGAASLQYAINAATVTTAEYDTGVQISGKLALCELDAVGNIIYLASDGSSQLSYQGSELCGHGICDHPYGIGSPVGLVKGFSRCLSEYSIDELKLHGIETGKALTLEFVSGIRVSGVVKEVVRRSQKNILLRFLDCVVMGLDGKFLFRPELGIYDMAVGTEIVSVFGGPADREHYPCYRRSTHAPGKPKDQSAIAKADWRCDPLMQAYAAVREMRDCGEIPLKSIEKLYREQKRHFPSEWLLLVELRELCLHCSEDSVLLSGVIARIDLDLQLMKQRSNELRVLIDYALEDVASAAA